MLITEEAEELVLDDGTTERAAGNVAVQLRNLVTGWDIGILVEEKRCGVDPVGAAVHVRRAVQVVRARCGAEIDVRAGS